MLFVVDLQYIAARKVKSGCALNPKLCPQSRESEPNFHEFMALSRATFQYNGSTGYPVCLTRRESEPVCRKFTALSPMIRTLQSTTGNLHRETTGKPQGRRPRHARQGDTVHFECGNGCGDKNMGTELGMMWWYDMVRFSHNIHYRTSITEHPCSQQPLPNSHGRNSHQVEPAALKVY